MHEYPIDHPLRRIALAYFENYDDEVGVRYALDCFHAQLGSYDLDEQEFADCLDFILDEALYNEEATLVASVLRVLCVLLLEEAFPDVYREPLLDRLSMLERAFGDEGIVLVPLVECLLGVQVSWVHLPKLQARAEELLGLIRGNSGDVVRLKAFAKGLGAFVFMPGVTKSQSEVCLALIQGLLEESDDWRVRVHVTQSLSSALKEGGIISGERLEQLLAVVVGFLDENHPQPLYRPVAQFCSKALIVGELNDEQSELCWNTLFHLAEMSKEGGTQRAVLQQLGIAMHWTAMTPEQENRCYAVMKRAGDEAEEEKTLYELMVVLAQALAGMYSWGRADGAQRWGEFFCALVLEVEPLKAYTCLNTFLKGPMGHFCFSEEHLDRLANDVLCYAENNKKGRSLCVHVLDAMVSSGFLNARYFKRFWELLLMLWEDDSFDENAGFRKYIARSASGLVTDLSAPEVVRLCVWDALVDLFQREQGVLERLLPIAQVFSILVSLPERLPQGVFDQSSEILLLLVSDPRDSVCDLGLRGVERILQIKDLEAPILAQAIDVYFVLEVSSASSELQMTYARVGQALLARTDISLEVRCAVTSRLERLSEHSDAWSVKRLVNQDISEA